MKFCVFNIISLSVLLRMRDISDRFLEKIQTICIQFFPQNLGAYETTWNNMIDPEESHCNKNGAYALHGG